MLLLALNLQAVSFVRSSQELFSLIYKLKKAKQQIRQQREGTSSKEEVDQKGIESCMHTVLHNSIEPILSSN